LGQYDNPLNIQGHEKITAPQLYQQMNGEIQIFASSLGTTGSFLGNIKYLKSKNANIVPLGVVRKPNNPIP
jgi:cystathionine beta-synthase